MLSGACVAGLSNRSSSVCIGRRRPRARISLVPSTQGPPYSDTDPPPSDTEWLAPRQSVPPTKSVRNLHLLFCVLCRLNRRPFGAELSLCISIRILPKLGRFRRLRGMERAYLARHGTRVWVKSQLIQGKNIALIWTSTFKQSVFG